ncbi:lysozyme [Brevundimonas aurifodinae]|uniref:Lysozyme n=2 Tax=Brevundimonas TaxID=41275 RepID=A0ABV1NSA9_9CAUL|nr:MAG: hypothetical protein B7Z01_13790 [Brevundimonas subvibrioides]
MSDASTPVRKISREGIVLIKSFEGFRPRAVQRAEGGWIIGYGHTLSAREGATVSETDAELLLRYDLLPIEKSVNDAAPGGVNQHQFDALVSFGFSVGRERFESSDVLARLIGGAPGEAAEAMMAWPAADVPSAGLRRRAAERALFGADPSRAISLAELLTAPVAEPEAPAEVIAPEPPSSADVAPETVEATEPVDSRGAALAALLGEPEAIVPNFAPGPVTSEPVAVDQAAPPTDSSDLSVAAEDFHAAPSVGVAANDTGADVEPADTSALPDEPFHGATEPPSETLSMEPRPAVAADDAIVGEAAAPAEAPALDVAAFSAQRYAPYGTPIIGPLPFLQPASAPVQEITETAPAAAEAASPAETLVLTSPEDAPPTVFARPSWTADERQEAEAIAQPEAGLFGDDLALTQGGQPLGRADFEGEPPERFDWSETGAFVIMGAVGLTAFGASMAAFRLASEHGGGDETGIIGWVLAVIGVACVGVSSLNLYRRFGLPGGDR